MNRLALPAFLAAAALLAGLAVDAKPVNYQVPPETIDFKPGPGVDVVKGNCGPCHSADYIETQPRGPKFKKDFWKAEVVKMIKVYGAPIKEADIDPIADYLATNY